MLFFSLRNIFVKNDRSILGEIGFTHEIANYNEDLDDNFLYYPNEYFDEKPIIENSFDIWSLGCVFYEITTGKKAFDRKVDILENNLPSLSRLTNENCLMEIIRDMLQIDKNNRIKICDVLKFLNPNIKKFKADTLNNIKCI